MWSGIYFEQSAMDLHLELIKAQLSWILWLVLKYLLKLLFGLDDSYTKFIWAIFKYGVEYF